VASRGVSSRGKTGPAVSRRARENAGAAPTGPETDAVTEALEMAHADAVSAKDWTRAKTLATALEERREALAAPNVVLLPARGRRGSR
jgi:hypothetical protein